MSRSRVFSIVTMAILCFTLTGCVVDSKEPLSDPDQAAADAKLDGAWIGTTDEVKTVWIIGRAGDSGERKDVPAGIMRAASTPIGKGGRVGKPDSWLFFVTTIGEHSYANVFDESALDTATHKTWNKANIASYSLVKYRQNGDRIDVWFGSADHVAEAIDKGLIKGEVKRDQNKRVTSARMTDSTANLVRFMQNGGDKLLYRDDPTMVLRRVSLKP